MAQICAFGAINVDAVYRVASLPRTGETCQAHSYHEYAGGKGANQAVAMLRLASPAGLVGCLGADERGRRLRGELEALGLDCSHVLEFPGEETAIATIAVDPAGQNFILVHEGPNTLITEEQAVRSVIEQHNLRVASIHAEWPVQVINALIRECARRQVRVVLNWTPARQLAPDAARLVDVAIVNEVEAADLVGIQVRNPEEAAAAAEAVRRLGPNSVAVTLGEQGAVYVDGHRCLAVAPPPVRAIDSTAAGDCFCAAIAVGMFEDLPVEESVTMAVLASALAVTKEGAIPSLPDRNALAEWIGPRPTLRLL